MQSVSTSKVNLERLNLFSDQSQQNHNYLYALCILQESTLSKFAVEDGPDLTFMILLKTGFFFAIETHPVTDPFFLSSSLSLSRCGIHFVQIFTRHDSRHVY